MFFGKTASGESVEQHTLVNSRGTSIDVLTLGAIIRRFIVPVNNQAPRDIVLGFDHIEHYLEDEHYLGCVVGRYANRIHKGQFVIDSKSYQVDINQAGNCLHGGSSGFNKRIWQIERASSHELCLSLVSPDGDQGFPGTLTFYLTYTLSDDDTLTIKYQAKSDQATLFNPTQHSYFNLDGHCSGDIQKHQLAVLADHILDIDENGIPSGELLSVKGSIFDVNQPKIVGNIINANNNFIKQAKGIDHNWCLTHQPSQEINARLLSTRQDLELQVSTTMPGLQVYSGNFLPTNNWGKGNTTYTEYQGICLETQFYPDSPNHKKFQSPVLRQGEDFISETRYKVIAHQQPI